MKQPSVFSLLWVSLLGLPLATLSMAASPTTLTLGVAAAATAICTVQPRDGLNFREGPGVTYGVIKLLPAGEQLTPQATSPDQQWVQAAWQPKTTGQSPIVGWVQFTLRYLKCDTPADKLPIATPPSPATTRPTSKSYSDLNSFLVGYAPTAKELGEHTAFQATLMVPSAALLNDVVVFQNQMVFELRFKQLDAPVKSLEISIFKGGGEEGDLIYHRTDYKAPFCAFGSDTEQCDRIWTFAETNYYWPKSESTQITPGGIPIDPTSAYTAQMVITTSDGRSGEWDLPFTVEAHFLHTASPANVTTNWANMNHPLINGNPNAILLVTQNWSPPGASGIYMNSLGVWYNGKAGRWAIFNQNTKHTMLPGAAFNVLLPAINVAAFVHQATAANTNASWTEIDYPLTNGNPNAILLVTQNWNPGGSGGQYNDHSIGVWYNTKTERWAIFNQDDAAMPAGAAFNVLVPTVDATAFVHWATAANSTAIWTEIDHPFTNGNPNAILLVTQNWNPGGSGGIHTDHPIAVWYNKQTGRWAIFNQDEAPMQVGVAFNVMAFNDQWKCPPC